MGKIDKTKPCVSCEDESVVKFDKDTIHVYMLELPQWEQVREGEIDQIKRNFSFPDFVAAIRFVETLADIAETEGHHPEIRVHSYNQVEVILWTHSKDGLTENDFIMAAKIDDVVDRLKMVE